MIIIDNHYIFKIGAKEIIIPSGNNESLNDLKLDDETSKSNNTSDLEKIWRYTTYIEKRDKLSSIEKDCNYTVKT